MRQAFSAEAARASGLGAILMDRYLEDAIEIDVDVLGPWGTGAS